MKYLQMVNLWYGLLQIGKIKSISIHNSLLSDAEELEDYLIVTLKKAIEIITKINEVRKWLLLLKVECPKLLE